MNKDLESITIDDLDVEQKELVDAIGLEAYKSLIATYGGTYIYVRKLDSFERVLRDRKICEEFNGYNIKKLALQYHLTEVQIRSIVKDIFEEKKNAPAKGQINLFDIM